MTSDTRYSASMIYTIRSHQTEKIYIGATCEKTLPRRMVQHRAAFRRFIAGTGKATSSREILIFGDAYIELLESFPCDSKDALRQREGFHIRANRSICVNVKIEGRTAAEYRIDNSEKFKQYRIDNSEKIKLANEKYRNDNKDKIKQYRIDNLEKLKIYNNKKIHCSYCCKDFFRNNKLRHIKSVKHIKNYKIAYLECFGEVFLGVLDIEDY
jgi:hypothetical protein